jgi:predicted phage-related endonuclease
MSVTFDTLTYAKKLRDAGFTQEQAEVQAHALADIVEERLATKQDIATLHRDIKELEAALKRDIKELEAALKHDIKELETSLKRDMKELETSLHRDMKEQETSLQRDMKDMEYRMTIRLGAMLAVSITIMGALVKLL